MARPSAEILLTQEIGDGTTWEILKAEAYFAITYKNEPVSIRISKGSMSGNIHLYRKMTYTNLGNAQAQVKRLNHRFKTTEFSVMVIE